MKERIRKIRKHLDITQQEFADRLGVKRGAIANYEVGRNEPTDSVISLICREFNVREEWLRTGEGEMFKPRPTDTLDRLAYENNFSNADYVVIEKFVSLQPQKRKELLGKVFDFLHEVEAALSDTEPFAPAYNGTEAPLPMDDFIKNYRASKSVNNEEAEPTTEELEEMYKKRISSSAPNTESSASNTTDDIKRVKNA